LRRRRGKYRGDTDGHGFAIVCATIIDAKRIT
jgi:hypothetical protein